MRLLTKKYNRFSDEDIMKAVINGDQRAFSEIYDRYAGAMLNYFYKMLWQNTELAEDFMQELFAKIIQKPHHFNPERSFKTWIYSIAANMCKNEYRSHEVRKGTTNSLHDNLSVSANDRSDDFLDKSAFKEKLKQELDNLSEIHRQTFILRFKQDLSIKEIAEIMETSEGTIKSRIFYALKNLSEQLKEFNPANIGLILLVYFKILML